MCLAGGGDRGLGDDVGAASHGEVLEEWLQSVTKGGGVELGNSSGLLVLVVLVVVVPPLVAVPPLMTCCVSATPVMLVLREGCLCLLSLLFGVLDRLRVILFISFGLLLLLVGCLVSKLHCIRVLFLHGSASASLFSFGVLLVLCGLFLGGLDSLLGDGCFLVDESSALRLLLALFIVGLGGIGCPLGSSLFLLAKALLEVLLFLLILLIELIPVFRVALLRIVDLLGLGLGGGVLLFLLGGLLLLLPLVDLLRRRLSIIPSPSQFGSALRCGSILVKERFNGAVSSGIDCSIDCGISLNGNSCVTCHIGSRVGLNGNRGILGRVGRHVLRGVASDIASNISLHGNSCILGSILVGKQDLQDRKCCVRRSIS